MITSEKRTIFQIEKIKKPISFYNKMNIQFKVLKRRKERVPWSQEEDEAINLLVNQHGNRKWTIIVKEMNNRFGLKDRSGKQYRERWHNHLDNKIKKDYWTKEEEKILFTKHAEFGNRWSEISEFLPGRTDNSIKNHFYSKLRKFLRKILKQISKDINEPNSVQYDVNFEKYDANGLSQIISREKINYNVLTKEIVINIILNYEKNKKLGIDQKFNKTRTLHHVTKKVKMRLSKFYY